MTIHGLYYFNAIGEIGYFDSPDDPYFLGQQQSGIGQSLFNTNVGIGWYFSRGQRDYGQIKLTFDGRCRALYDSTRTYIVVVGQKKPQIAAPANAAVFDEDGALNHVVGLPPWVEHSFDGNTAMRYLPEGFAHVQYDAGRVVLGIYFQFEWVQLRVYDPFSREWGETIGVYRQ